ncbi:uncharacterized protein [Oryza sativa Japonica Group]|uniref:uncharacterized protein isoform X2 n=1 Tax=Oryza sativa subsp. japonica TaxID=39947 RepID=UPI0007755446|nr:uncharacterized protein LOC4327161 isoform X2 [Oryza sativa Japonica Group]
MVRPARVDSLPVAALEETARLVRRAAPKRRVAELNIEAQQASGARRGGCRRHGGRGGGVLGADGVQVLTEERHGGGVLGADGVQLLTEDQHACGYLSDAEWHPGGCFVPESEDQACGGIDNSELPPDSGFVHVSQDEASNDVPDSDLPPDGGFVPDSEDEASGGVDDSELPPDGCVVPDSEDEASSGGDDSELPPNGCVVPDSEDEASGCVHDFELAPDGCVVPDSEDETSGGVHDSELPPEGCIVPDSEDEASGGGVLNLEQKPEKGIFANLEEQHMDGIEQLVGGEEVAGLQDDVGVSAGDGGVDEFAEIREIGQLLYIKDNIDSFGVHSVVLKIILQGFQLKLQCFMVIYKMFDMVMMDWCSNFIQLISQATMLRSKGCKLRSRKPPCSWPSTPRRLSPRITTCLPSSSISISSLRSVFGWICRLMKWNEMDGSFMTSSI